MRLNNKNSLLSDDNGVSIKVDNANVHNDYTREVLPVFEIFAYRIQITSYGELLTGLSKEYFFSCRSMSCNRELMRVFKDIGLVEQLGSGMSRILKAYNKSLFDISDNFMVVKFAFGRKNIKGKDYFGSNGCRKFNCCGGRK